jgi:hypothetical protein
MFLTMLQWRQAKVLLPELAAAAASNALSATIVANLKDFFAHTGAAFRKPACALLLRQIPVQQAAEIAGVAQSYIHASRSPQYVPTTHRLFTEQYAVGTTRARIHELEVMGSREWARTTLGAKSGQIDDTCYLYDAKDAFYHEKYQR